MFRLWDAGKVWMIGWTSAEGQVLPLGHRIRYEGDKVLGSLAARLCRPRLSDGGQELLRKQRPFNQLIPVPLTHELQLDLAHGRKVTCGGQLKRAL